MRWIFEKSGRYQSFQQKSFKPIAFLPPCLTPYPSFTIYLIPNRMYRGDVSKVYMLHKLGKCPIGEISILIYISSAHRVHALQASQYAIDTLKATVPIWKKEFYEDGSDAVWKANAKEKETSSSSQSTKSQV